MIPEAAAGRWGRGPSGDRTLSAKPNDVRVRERHAPRRQHTHLPWPAEAHYRDFLGVKWPRVNSQEAVLSKVEGRVPPGGCELAAVTSSAETPAPAR